MSGGGGKTLRYLLAAFFALAAAQTAQAATIDMGGSTESTTNLSTFKYNNTEIKNNVLANGTLNVTGNQAFADGTFTFGSGLTLNQTANQWGISGGRTVKFIDGATLNYTSTSDIYFGRTADGVTYNGTSQLILDNGIVDASAALYFSPKTSSSYNDKNVVLNFVMTNGSVLTLPTDKELRFGEVTQANSKKHATLKVTAGITNSTITAKQVRVGLSTSYITDTGNSYNNVTFGPGTVLNVGQIYSYAYPAPTVVLDGVKINWLADKGDSIIGQNNGVTTRIYTIGPNGLVINKESGYSRTEVSTMASALSGTGGITKTGPGDITWNTARVGSSTSEAMTFTGPLVVSNGTWTSSLGYAASAFKSNGGTLVLSGALSAANVALEATEGGTLTLAGAAITDSSPDMTLAGGGTTDYFTRDSAVTTYTLDSLTLGEGAVLDLDANATTIDVIDATTTNITATAASPATINLNFTALPSPGQTFSLFETDGADKFTVVPKLGNVLIPNEVALVDGVLTLTVTADNYTWNGTGSNWGDTGAWTKNDASADWADGNNAIFSTANSTATLAANASPAKIEFSADATVDGSATLTAPAVSVASDVAATIAAPTAGALEKTGAGTLTLGSSRTEQTTLSEGTLKMSAAALDATKLTLGTDAAKPVTLDYGGQTLTGDLTPALGGYDASLTNGNFTSTVTLRVADGTLRVKKDASVSVANSVCIGGTSATDNSTTINALLEIDGGAVTNSVASKHCVIGDYGAVGSVSRLVLKSGADYYSRQDIMVANGSTGYLTVDNSTMTAYGWLYFCNEERCAAGENGYVSLTNNGVLAVQRVVYGSSENGNGYFNFDGGTLRATSSDKVLLEAKERLFVTVNAEGGTIDNDGKNVTISADLLGAGDMTFTGSGKTTIGGLQTGSGALFCNATETIVNAGLSVARPVTVKDDKKLTINATAKSTINSLTLEAGSTLNIASYTAGVTPFAVTTLTLPAEGSVMLTLNGGAFAVGRYAILEKTGITLAEVQGKLVPSIGTLSGTFDVSDDTLYLVVKGANDVIWIGGTDTKLSTDANWFGGSAPSEGQNAVICVPSETTLVCDANFTPAAITFTADSAAIAINGEHEITSITSITNLSSNSHTINVPVRFAGNIQVSQNADYYDHISLSHITFAGGAYAAEGCAIETGATVNWSRCMFGKYYLANGSNTPWTATEYENCRPAVASDSELYVPYAGKLTELDVASNAKVFVGDMSLDGRLMHKMAAGGEVVVTNLTVTGTADWFMTYNQGTTTSSVFKFNSVTNKISQNKWLYFGDANASSKQTVFFGEGGIVFDGSDTTCVCFGNNNKDNTETTVRPWYSDFTIGGKSNGNKDVAFDHDVVFNTDDEGGTGRTITLDAITYARNSPTITVSGSGTLRVNKDNDNNAHPPVTVKDTATLAYKPGASLGTGGMTVKKDATFEVSSGTTSVGNLTLDNGATLKFNFTEANSAPVLNLTDKTVTFETAETTNVTVSVSANQGVRPVNREKKFQLTSGGKFSDALVAKALPRWAKELSVVKGDIWLEVKPIGLVFTIY